MHTSTAHVSTDGYEALSAISAFPETGVCTDAPLQEMRPMFKNVFRQFPVYRIGQIWLRTLCTRLRLTWAQMGAKHSPHSILYSNPDSDTNCDVRFGFSVSNYWEFAVRNWLTRKFSVACMEPKNVRMIISIEIYSEFVFWRRFRFQHVELWKFAIQKCLEWKFSVFRRNRNFR